VSRVTVYSHFATREELIEAVVARATRAATDSIEAARPAEGDPVEALECVLSVSWEQLERHEGIRRAAAEELDPAAIARSHASAARMLRRLIERGRRAGAFRKDLPPEWLIASCLGLLHTAADEVREKQLRSDEAMSAVKTTVIELFTGRPLA
jgi:TetR/AcrR family transcriptional repressor of mexCD-oprJ operon